MNNEPTVTPNSPDPTPVTQPIIAQPIPNQPQTGTGGPLNSGHNGKSKHRRGSSGFREFLSTASILVTALIVAFLMITFVFRSYQVDGPSMQNTLQNADKLIIWKVPRTWARLTHHNYIPARGDIIVFNECGLSQFGQADCKQLIKRVIGLPGDRVVVNNGDYTIFNKQNPKGFDPDKTLGYFKGVSIPITSGNVDVTLGSNQLFASGDNRPDSLDSRAFGPINANQVVGKLIYRVYPLNQSKTF